MVFNNEKGICRYGELVWNRVVSYVGRIGSGAQPLYLDIPCQKVGVATHEIFHALGFHHEHQPWSKKLNQISRLNLNNLSIANSSRKMLSIFFLILTNLSVLTETNISGLNGTISNRLVAESIETLAVEFTFKKLFLLRQTFLMITDQWCTTMDMPFLLSSWFRFHLIQ